MKRNKTKRDMNKFTKRTASGARSKERMRRELLRAIEATGVSADGVRIGFSSERSSAGGRTAVGIFHGTKNGYGFVTPEGGESERDIFVPEDKTLGALDGDTVEVVYREYLGYSAEQKTEGRVKKILSFGRDKLVGTVGVKRSISRGRTARGSILYLVPDDPKISIEPKIVENDPAMIGDKVLVGIKRNTYGGIIPECKVIFTFGQAGTITADEAAILAENGIEEGFTDEELDLAHRLAKKPIDTEGRRRIDSRVITIDGEGAKDLDDAVSLSKTKDGYVLSVHIADVSYYVEERTALDRLCFCRGNSVYFVDKVIPMLPPELSNGSCSLHPGEDKATITCKMTLSKEGKLLFTEIFPSVIRSDLRGVYSEINSLFEGCADERIKAKYASSRRMLSNMRELSALLYQRALERGYLDMDLPDSVILLGEDGEPSSVLEAERGESERIIEMFMLLANEAVATKLTEAGVPCVYRVHEPIPEDNLKELGRTVGNLGLDPSLISPEAKDGRALCEILSKARELGKEDVISYTLLRSMAKARYSHLPEGHFGLGLKNYCHFTSPIRRLSDLVTHRIIRRVIFEGKDPERYRSMARRAAAAATDREAVTVRCERRIEDMYKALYMKKFVGEELEGRVSSITSFGIFVRLPNTCEGLISAAAIPGLYLFDKDNMTVKIDGGSLRIGDPLRVVVDYVDTAAYKIYFSLPPKHPKRYSSL